MPGLISTPAQDRFTTLLGAYLALNKRNAGELVARRAKGVSLALYQETVKHAPSKMDIARKVISLGWRVKRKAGAWPLKASEKRGSKGPLKRMQAAQIGRRSKAIGFVATGWLPAVRKFGGQNTGKRLVQVKNPRGSVTITGFETGNPTITITNSTPGIAKMQQKYNIVRSAFNAESKDMATYIRRKIAENGDKLK